MFPKIWLRCLSDIVKIEYNTIPNKAGIPDRKGIQWHPEYGDNLDRATIYKAFVNEVIKYKKQAEK